MSVTTGTPDDDRRRNLPTVYDRSHDVAAFIRETGNAIYKSRMFGCETPEQGHVLALECAAKRMPPLAMAERYHLIKGKLSMKAEAMLADFHTQCGGEHEIVERSPDKAAIKVSFEGKRKSYTFELAWEDALKEPFVFNGKESDIVTALAAGENGKKALQLKPKYATPRARMQMLWARVVSDAIRAVAPEVVAGHYTPEEVSDIHGMDTLPADEIVVEPTAEPAEQQAEHVGGNGSAATDTPKPDAEQAEIDRLKAEAEAKMAAAKANEAKLVAEQPADLQRPTVSTGTGKATPEQIAEVKQLVTELTVDREKLAAMLKKAGAAKVSDLSEDYCDNLLDALKRQKAKLAGN